LIDKFEGLIDKLEYLDAKTTKPQEIQNQLNRIFLSCCSDHLGAVAVRQSYDAYLRMAQSDLRECQDQGNKGNWNLLESYEYLSDSSMSSEVSSEHQLTRNLCSPLRYTDSWEGLYPIEQSTRGGQRSFTTPPPSEGLWDTQSPSQPNQASFQSLLSSASTRLPASTEGSADPAKNDTEELGIHASTFTPVPTASVPTISRWVHLRVPGDIFTNPPDPIRHQLYHQIRQEPWFNRQQTERQLTADESKGIPGSTPGESVLLAFYDRVTNAGNRAALECAICKRTNQSAQLYQSPDRAKVHMRHHFDLRPVLCNRQCGISQWYALIFTPCLCTDILFLSLVLRDFLLKVILWCI
jgi:hypothetical protein